MHNLKPFLYLRIRMMFWVLLTSLPVSGAILGDVGVTFHMRIRLRRQIISLLFARAPVVHVSPPPLPQTKCFVFLII
jgi:hypothetical protein